MSRVAVTGLVYGFLFAVAAAVGWQLPSNPSALPAPFATPAVKNYPQVVARPAGGQLHYPNGFRVEEWAKGFSTPRYLLQGRKNGIILADSGSHDPGSAEGVIYVFPRATGCGAKRSYAA